MTDYSYTPMKILPNPYDTNPPVDFRYLRHSDGSVGAAVYDTRTQLELWQTTIDTNAKPAAAPLFNPLGMVSQMLAGTDSSSGAAPTDGMHVIHPFPFCPVAIGCWLPVPNAQGNLEMGIAILCAYTNTVLCYRKCEINPTDHSFSISQKLPVVGTCAVTMQFKEPAGFTGTFSMSDGVFPPISVTVPPVA